MNDLISRQAAIDAFETIGYDFSDSGLSEIELEEVCVVVGDVRQDMINLIKQLPSAEPERLTDDDFETIRIHLSACKEELCNQQRWKEAEEYQHIIDRLMAFASTQPELHEGHWIDKGWDGDWRWRTDGRGDCWRVVECSECGKSVSAHCGKNDPLESNFCPHCGAKMKGGEQNGEEKVCRDTSLSSNNEV